MHLTAVADLADTAIVRDQSVASWPPSSPRQPETSRDDRAQSIRADDDLGANLGTIGESHAARATGGVPHDIDDVRRFAKVGASVARGADENRVENLALHGEPAVAESLHRTAGELTDDSRSARRADDHARELRRAGTLDFFQHLHRREDARRLRAEILGAGFGTRKGRAVEDDRPRSASRQRERECAAGRSSADDYDRSVPGRCHHPELYPVIASAINPPARPQRRFTLSLFSAAKPPMGRVGVPQS